MQCLTSFFLLGSAPASSNAATPFSSPVSQATSSCIRETKLQISSLSVIAVYVYYYTSYLIFRAVAHRARFTPYTSGRPWEDSCLCYFNNSTSTVRMRKSTGSRFIPDIRYGSARAGGYIHVSIHTCT